MVPVGPQAPRNKALIVRLVTHSGGTLLDTRFNTKRRIWARRSLCISAADSVKPGGPGNHPRYRRDSVPRDASLPALYHRKHWEQLSCPRIGGDEINDAALSTWSVTGSSEEMVRMATCACAGIRQFRFPAFISRTAAGERVLEFHSHCEKSEITSLPPAETRLNKLLNLEDGMRSVSSETDGQVQGIQWRDTF